MVCFSIDSPSHPQRLSGIALLNTEKDFRINIDQIVTNFIAKKYERKMIFWDKSFFKLIYFLFTLFQQKKKQIDRLR